MRENIAIECVGGEGEEVRKEELNIEWVGGKVKEVREENLTIAGNPE